MEHSTKGVGPDQTLWTFLWAMSLPNVFDPLGNVFAPSIHLNVAFLYILSCIESVPLVLGLISEIVVLYVQ